MKYPLEQTGYRQRKDPLTYGRQPEITLLLQCEKVVAQTLKLILCEPTLQLIRKSVEACLKR